MGKFTLLICVVGLFALTLAAPPTIPKEFRSINVDNYLRNPRNVKFQMNCLLYNGPCDRIGKYLKETIPDFIRTNCAECDPDVKVQAQKVATFLEKNNPKEWSDALKKFGISDASFIEAKA